MQEATLCLLLDETPPRSLLLGLKKTGFGQGKYVGFGGKIEAGETIVQAAARELAEETGLHVALPDLKQVAHLTFRFPARPAWDHLVHVFLTRSWSGQSAESGEVRPAWFRVDALPFPQMWDDAAYWLPPILAGQRLRGHFVFDDDNDTVSRCEILPWPEDLAV